MTIPDNSVSIPYTLIDVEQVRKVNFMKVIYISLCFMMMLTAYMSAQNLMTDIYDELGFKSLGQICFFCLFGGQLISSLISTHYYKKVSLRICMLIAVFFHILFIFCGLLATYCAKYHDDRMYCSHGFVYTLTIIVASVLGLAISFVWLAQAKYVNYCADDPVRGKFNGAFGAIEQVAQILSTGIAALVLRLADNFIFYLVISLLGVITLIMFSVVQPPMPYAEGPEAEEEEESLKESLKRFINAALDKKIFFVYAGSIFAGIGSALLGNIIAPYSRTTIHSDDNQYIKGLIALVLVVLAVGQISGGLVVAHFADKMNKFKLFCITMIFVLVGIALIFFAYYYENYVLMLACGLLWGIADSSSNTMIGIIVGEQFQARAEVFSVVRACKGISGMATSLLAMSLSREHPYILMLVMSVLLVIFKIDSIFLQVKHKETTTKSS